MKGATSPDSSVTAYEEVALAGWIEAMGWWQIH